MADAGVTVSSRARSIVVAISATLFIVLLASALVYRHRLPIDQQIHDWTMAHRANWLNPFAVGATELGSSPVLYLVLLAAAAYCAGRRIAWRPIVVIGLLLLAETGLRTLLSLWVARARPPSSDWLLSASGYAFPSGHTANATLAYGLLAWIISRQAYRPRLASAMCAGAVALALAVGCSRVYLGVHWPTDVVASWTWGVCWLFVSTRLLVWWLDRSTHSAAAPVDRQPSQRRDDGSGRA